MIEPGRTKLFLAPDRVYVEAKIVSLTEKMADDLILRGWWDEQCLDIPHDQPLPIDRYWNLQRLGLDPILFEGNLYTPMELPGSRAQEMLAEEA